MMEVTTRRYPAWTTLGESTGTSSLKGEAVFVDLGEGSDGKPRNLIALLARGMRGENVNFNLLPGQAFEWLFKQQNRVPRFVGTEADVLGLPLGSIAPLRGELLPTLITFNDFKDPATARVVPPDDLERSFGKGVRLHDATIKIVSVRKWPLTLFGLMADPVTRELEKHLLWWNEPNRPAVIALRAAGLVTGASIDAELAFKRG